MCAYDYADAHLTYLWKKFVFYFVFNLFEREREWGRAEGERNFSRLLAELGADGGFDLRNLR